MSLPIEQHEKIMTEYGRATAYLNMLDGTLNLILGVMGGLRSANILMVNELLDEMMMGKKIKLAERFLSKKSITKLWTINEKRVLLAHGVTGGGEDLTIFHKKTAMPFTIEFLKEIVELAKTLNTELMEEIIRFCK